jgi:hypothetical protein
MELQDGYNGEVPKNNADVTLTPHNERIEKCIRFYSATFHLIAIPIGIAFAIIHLKFAIGYLGQCTIQPMINIYLIVYAAVDLFIILLALAGVINVRCIYSRSENPNHKMIARRLIMIVVSLTLVTLLFSFAWLVTGSVWIFGAKRNGVQGSDPTAVTTYCQSDLYRAAFILIIVNYVIHFLIIPLIILKRICCKRENAIPNPSEEMNKA